MDKIKIHSQLLTDRYTSKIADIHESAFLVELGVHVLGGGNFQLSTYTHVGIFRYENQELFVSDYACTCGCGGLAHLNLLLITGVN